MSRIHFGTCPLCEACCGIQVTVKGGRIEDIRGDEAHPLSHGYICPKAAALADLHHDPDRLKLPRARRGDQWEELSWEQALDEVAEELAAIRAANGPDSIAAYRGNPTVHSLGDLTFGTAFFQLLRTKNLYSATSVDQLPHMLSSLVMFGHQLLLPIPDIERTDLFVIFGANPVVSNGSIMTAPNMKGRLRTLRARGGRVVVVDPRRTETAAEADEHLFIRPGTDALFLLGILHALHAEGLVSLGRLGPLATGAERLRELVKPFSPERVAPAIAVPAQVIRRLARELASTPRAVCYGRMGTCTQAFGALTSWLINLVNICTRHLDEEGGAMFPTPAVELDRASKLLGYRGGFDRYRSRVRNLPEFCGEFPVATLAEEISTPGRNRIRALITSAGNPVLSTPGGSRLAASLEELDLMVSVAPYLNETTRHAHYILPPTGPLERSHYDLVFLGFAVRNFVHYSTAAVERGAEQRHDWEIFHELGARLHLGRALGKRALRVAERGQRLVGAKLTPELLVDAGLRLGPHGRGLMPGGLSLRKLRQEPHGIDLGPLQSRLPGALTTANKTLELTPSIYLDDLDRLAASLSAPVPALVLIGRRTQRSNNSWLHNSQRLVKGPPRCVALLHPSDAAARDIRSGDSVTVHSRGGEITLPAQVSDEIMEGVVSIPHGWGHGREGTELSVANAHPGVSTNDLTDELFVDELCGVAAFSGVPITLSKLHS